MSFLKKIDMLEVKLASESPEVVKRGLQYCKAFRSFHGVVESSFGNSLRDDYKVNISIFKKDYTELGITITPKVNT